jgi:transcriptional regulator of arginine metabolism
MPAATEIREKRQETIREILDSQPVVRQSQLVALLRKRGIKATQSSVSRDLKQLGIAKLDDGYVEPAPAELANLDHIVDFVRDIETAGANLTVIRTATGAAQRVAVFLDRSGWPEIVGTLSGDDTIFIATKNAGKQRQLLVRLKSHFSD